MRNISMLFHLLSSSVSHLMTNQIYLLTCPGLETLISCASSTVSEDTSLHCIHSILVIEFSFFINFLSLITGFCFICFILKANVWVLKSAWEIEIIVIVVVVVVVIIIIQAEQQPACITVSLLTQWATYTITFSLKR